MRIFVAIDDTDNSESKGTGFRARELAVLIQKKNLGLLYGVTRHQLFVHEKIPYTSHNSSACIVLIADEKNLRSIIDVSAQYLIENAADGSDAGLCVCSEKNITAELISYAKKAKTEVLTMDTAIELAQKHQIFLEGFTGTRQGVIGSLAAIGLHAEGNDGRFLQVRGMRELFGVHTVKYILEYTGVEKIMSTENKILFNFEKIFLTEWWRPVLNNKQAVLYVETKNACNYEYRVISKEHIKNISD
ncbi:MAG TPA: hypothetical protein PKW80_06890 [Bacteroidales bacterium]|nr:hypothetical protein [Bacteroidales bacterium]